MAQRSVEDMPELEQSMMLIKSLDDSASLLFSAYTRQWYVNANIEVSDGCVIGGITEHAQTPDQAVYRYMVRLMEIDEANTDWVLVTDSFRPTRRHWRWNGQTFIETERLSHRHSEVIASDEQEGTA